FIMQAIVTSYSSSPILLFALRRFFYSISAKYALNRGWNRDSAGCIGRTLHWNVFVRGGKEFAEALLLYFGFMIARLPDLFQANGLAGQLKTRSLTNQ